MNKEISYGLVLEGANKTGAYQLGALRALKTHNIKITSVVGSTIGAFNGALFCQNDIDLGYGIWENLPFDKIFTSDIQFLKNLIHQHIKENTIRLGVIEYGLMAYNLKGNQSIEVFLDQIPEGKLAAYILSSNYTPPSGGKGLGDTPYIEGGFFSNSPIQMLLKKEYKNIIVIKSEYKDQIQNSYDAFDKKVIVIEPNQDLVSGMAFGLDLVRTQLQRGYYDALRVIDNLKGQRYYISEMPDEQRIVNRWGYINKQETLVLKSIWPSKIEAPSRYLFEVVLQGVATFLEMDQHWSYETLLIGIIEYFAHRMDYRLYKTYGYEVLCQDLLQQIKVYKKEQPCEIALEILLRLMLRE